MPTSAQPRDDATGRCLSLPDQGVAPGAASRLPRWCTASRPEQPPRMPTAFPTSERALPQADGAA